MVVWGGCSNIARSVDLSSLHQLQLTRLRSTNITRVPLIRCARQITTVECVAAGALDDAVAAAERILTPTDSHIVHGAGESANVGVAEPEVAGLAEAVLGFRAADGRLG